MVNLFLDGKSIFAKVYILGIWQGTFFRRRTIKSPCTDDDTHMLPMMIWIKKWLQWFFDGYDKYETNYAGALYTFIFIIDEWMYGIKRWYFSYLWSNHGNSEKLWKLK